MLAAMGSEFFLSAPTHRAVCLKFLLTERPMSGVFHAMPLTPKCRKRYLP